MIRGAPLRWRFSRLCLGWRGARERLENLNLYGCIGDVILAANDMGDFFDFVSPPRLAVPPLPDQPAINPDMGWNDAGAGVCDRTLETDPNQP